MSEGRAEALLARIAHVRSKLDEACAGWDHSVSLCAVTKTVDAQTVNASFDAGIRIIGENRVQEALQKIPALNPQFALHIIGQLQTNKVKYVVEIAQMVQSLDRVGLAQELDRRAQACGRRMPVLVQVNIAKEPQKAGIFQEELPAFVHQCARLPGIQVQGLMAMMPIAQDPEALRPLFRSMRGLFERLGQESIEGVHMDHLSMGMSDDYIVAAQEGATMVRLGSALYKF